MTPNDSGPNQPTDDEQATDHFSEAEAHLEGEVSDALATIGEALRGGDVDADDLAAFRRRLAELDILVEDSLEAAGEIDVEGTPELYAQDIARDLWARSVGGDAEGVRAEMTRLDYHLENPETPSTAIEKGAEGGSRDAKGRGDGGETGEQIGDSAAGLRAAPYVWLDSSVASARIRPTDRPYLDGHITMHTYPRSGEIDIGLGAEREDVDLEMAYRLSLADAEELAEVILEFAEKGREGKEWVYP